ncbi:unnamed protein product [Durusdinium trenchii]|uniref:Uncharacterized protein n=1 Tax=Durusdinium trenchii TaxID=1381693 RepID=A0ABP0MVV6_9DINO
MSEAKDPEVAQDAEVGQDAEVAQDATVGQDAEVAEDAEVGEDAEVEDESLMSKLSEAMRDTDDEPKEPAAPMPDAPPMVSAVKPEPAEDAETGAAEVPQCEPESAQQEEVQEEQEPEEDLLDDIVPYVTYDEKGNFSKEGRWVQPKRSQFPCIFCPLRVRVRLSPEGSSEVNPWKLPVDRMASMLRTTLGLTDLVRFDDCRDRIDAAANAREVIVALNGDLPEGLGVGDVKEVEEAGKITLFLTIIDTVETSIDTEPERIASLEARLKEAGPCDALVLELPQIWIISDPDFRAKSASIGLYPGSFWMGFLKSWGAVQVAEVFFRKAGDTGQEPMVSVAVQFRERENLKMCFTFLYDRYLVHPKQKNALRPPWCRLVVFEDFKARTLGRPRPPQRPKAAKASLQINRPLTAAKAKAKILPKAMPVVPKAPMSKAKAKGPEKENVQAELTPAEAMAGLSGRQLEAFQMVMSRMERLERENKELMQVLIQMQALLQQSQQRNEQLAGIARADPSNAAARVALQAQQQAMASQATMPAVVPPPPLPTAASVPPPASEAEKRKASAEPEAENNAPWKAQRRRQRRRGEGDGPGETEEGDGAGGGLAAYHNALLGV